MKKDEITIGKCYGRALFDIALENNCLEQIYEEMMALKEVYQHIPKLGQWLTEAFLSAKQKAQLTQTLVQAFSPLMQRFLTVVYDYKRLDCVPAMADAFKDYYNAHHGIVEGTVTSVVPLTEAQLQQLSQQVQQLFHVTKVQLNNKLDSDIIGGIVIDVNHRVIDRTLKRQLKEMERAILKA